MTAQNGTRAGRITKPYGLSGEVVMILAPKISDRIHEGIPLFIGLAGQRIPFFIESAEVTGKDQAIIKFEFIGDPDEARKICDCEAYLEPDPDVAAESSNDHGLLVGYKAFDTTTGLLGEITDFIDTDMNPTWLISHKGRELMVPATEAFISGIDHQLKELHLDLPPGLTEL